MVLFALMLALAATAQAAPEVLSPSGKWQVEYAKSSCVISRAFGQKPQATLFGLKPAPNSETMTVLIIQPSPKGRGVRGKAEVKLSGGLVPESADYSSVTANGMRVTMIGLPRITLNALTEGQSISIRADKWVNVALRPTSFDKALAALKECEADLLESWGFDRAAQAAVAGPPKGNLHGLFQADDYPGQLIEKGVQGTVGFRLRIEADGSVSQCVAIESSGSTDLDKHSCKLVQKRARYSPAVGHDGRPIWSFTFGRVTWMIE